MFGKISEENMNAIVTEFSKWPETAALISPDKFPNNIGEVFFDEKKKGRADVLIIEEDSLEHEVQLESLDTWSKTNKHQMAFSERGEYALKPQFISPDRLATPYHNEIMSEMVSDGNRLWE